MKRESKYFKAMDKLHVPDEDYKEMKNRVLENYDRLNNKTSVFTARKRVAAAVIILCLIVIPSTAYAAICFTGLSKLFNIEDTDSGLVSQLSKYAVCEKTSVQNSNYRLTLINNLYNKEQQIGIAVCSCLNYNENADLWFDVRGKNLSGSGERWVDLGENDSDGGRLIGIYYSLAAGAEVDINSTELYVVMEISGKEELRLKMPECNDFETVKLVSDKMPDTEIILSPVGIKCKLMSEKDIDKLYAHFDFEKVMYIVYNNGDTVRVADIKWSGVNCGTGVPEGDFYEWGFIPEKPFDVDNIKSIKINDDPFNAKFTAEFKR